MLNRGYVNIGVAKYLEKNVNNLGLQNSSDVNHIIIGRLYYGLYLMAKNKLGYRDSDDVKHRTRNQAGIWVQLANHAKNRLPQDINIFDNIKKGEDLFRIRCIYEYGGLACDDLKLIEARGLFEVIKNELQKI